MLEGYRPDLFGLVGSRLGIGGYRGSHLQQFLEGIRELGSQVLVVLHFEEVVLNGAEDGVKLLLVRLLADIELNYSALEDVDEVEEEAVIGLFLLTGGKTGVYRHIYFYLYITNDLRSHHSWAFALMIAFITPFLKSPFSSPRRELVSSEGMTSNSILKGASGLRCSLSQLEYSLLIFCLMARFK